MADEDLGSYFAPICEVGIINQISAVLYEECLPRDDLSDSNVGFVGRFQRVDATPQFSWKDFSAESAALSNPYELR